jgi:WD40 repeat protein
MASLVHSFETDSAIHSISIAKNDCVITGSINGKITVWDLGNRKEIRSFQAHSKYFPSLAITGDGRRAVSGNNRVLKVWDIQTGSLCREIETFVDRTNKLLITPDGLCLSGHEYGGLFLWDIQNGKRLKSMEAIEVSLFSRIMADPDAITAMTLTPDGNKVITGTYHGFLKVWDLSSYRNTHTVMGHGLWVTGIILLPDGQHGMSVAYDGTVKTWAIEGDIVSETLYEGMPPISVIVMKPNLRRAIWGTQKGMLYFWDIKRRTIRSEIHAHEKAINGAVVTSDRQLLTVSDDATLKVWDLG